MALERAGTVSRPNEEFERLVGLYHSRVFSVALRFCGDHDEAAELTQETFVRAFRAWGKFRKESQTYTWLYRILVNLNKDRLARQSRRRDRETSIEAREEMGSPVPAAEHEAPDTQAQRTELKGLLEEAIESLPPGYRECVVLRDVEGLSYEEIAGVMGITVEAVRSRLARARQQLRQKLAPYLNAR
ncbi:MAG: ECF RNA polymerase sigma factor SigE [Fimbriimonadales bacterium]|nr:ECF RNA polymerase sigma factor SigE [Fimbriimonadales bacterium]NOG93234.1 sigma-70 family RNA polymerase sigma factor [Armatimonadota bacterium]